MAWTRSHSGGREHARPNTGGAAAEHATKIYSVAGASIAVIIAFLALTSIGHVVAAATQHFMLFYAGVFALIALCASVGLGLVSTDRMFLNPARRVFIQSAHRAASFGAVTFLIVHIVTEILAQRVHVIDAVIPFLSPFRTFYIGLGTIASDLIILLVVTGILRGRFNASGKAWRWRAIHYTSYASFVFGVWHGLLAGRAAKPYVDWSYGFLIAVVLLGLAVRVLSNSLKPKENLSTPPVPESAVSASAPLRAAAMAAQLGVARGGRGTVLGAGRSFGTGGQPLLTAPVLTATALPAEATQPVRQPYYEPGYEGPPRHLGAPRPTGTGPMPRAATGPMPRAGTGPMPRATTGPLPRATTGPLPRVNTGPLPRVGTGPVPRFDTGPMPLASTGPLPRVNTGPLPRVDTGPVPRSSTGPIPQVPAGPRPGEGPGPWPAAGTGPLPPFPGWLPPAPGGLHPGHPSGPMPRATTGPMPRATAGPIPRSSTGPIPRVPAGPRAGEATGPRPPRMGGLHPYAGGLPPYADGLPPAASGGLYPGHPSGPMLRVTGPQPRVPAGPPPPAGSRPYPRGETMPPGRHERAETFDPGPSVWADDGPDSGWFPAEPPRDGGYPGTDPDFRYREPGPGMPGYRGSREHRYGGDRR